MVHLFRSWAALVCLENVGECILTRFFVDFLDLFSYSLCDICKAMGAIVLNFE